MIVTGQAVQLDTGIVGNQDIVPGGSLNVVDVGERVARGLTRIRRRVGHINGDARGVFADIFVSRISIGNRIFTCTTVVGIRISPAYQDIIAEPAIERVGAALTPENILSVATV